ncbi:MAG: endonuclease domain-containing protein [Syntrophobacteraceae bacterium]
MTRRQILPYNPKLKALARELRNRSTLSEVLLWNQLKGSQVRGSQFLRQKPIDNYILDFFCYDLMLAIEIDGQSHDNKVEEDAIRQQRLESFGIVILRFLDIEVKRNMEGVIQSIVSSIEQIERENRRSKE